MLIKVRDVDWLHIKLDCCKADWTEECHLQEQNIHTTPFVKPRNILNLPIWNVFYIQLYVDSALSTIQGWPIFRLKYGICFVAGSPGHRLPRRRQPVQAQPSHAVKLEVKQSGIISR